MKPLQQTAQFSPSAEYNPEPHAQARTPLHAQAQPRARETHSAPPLSLVSWPTEPKVSPTPPDAERAWKVDVRRSIFDFDAAAWNRLVPRDEPHLRFAFLEAAETSRMIKNPTYIAVYHEQKIVGVAVAHENDIDLLTLASPSLSRFATVIRRGPLKRFLIARAISCGPVVTNCRPNVFLSPALSPAAACEVAALLIKALDEIEGGAFRVLFEYSMEAAHSFAPALERLGYVRGASLPGTKLEIVWPSFEAYTGAMRKFYRRAINDDLRAADGLEIKVESDFSALANEAHALYENVLAKATNVVDRLTPEFFAALGHFEQARLVTAREKSSGRLVGIELILLGDTQVQDLYTGVDYALNGKHNIYFNLIYPGIALACREGFKTVSTGQTSYAFKSRLGVKSHELSVFVKHRKPFVHSLIRRFIKVLCPTVTPPTHRVFHSDAETDAPKSAMPATTTPKARRFSKHRSTETVSVPVETPSAA